MPSPDEDSAGMHALESVISVIGVSTLLRPLARGNPLGRESIGTGDQALPPRAGAGSPSGARAVHRRPRGPDRRPAGHDPLLPAAGTVAASAPRERRALRIRRTACPRAAAHPFAPGPAARS